MLFVLTEFSAVLPGVNSKSGGSCEKAPCVHGVRNGVLSSPHIDSAEFRHGLGQRGDRQVRRFFRERRPA